jgi:DNA-directed RNA polymerase subunit omega
LDVGERRARQGESHEHHPDPAVDLALLPQPAWGARPRRPPLLALGIIDGRLSVGRVVPTRVRPALARPAPASPGPRATRPASSGGRPIARIDDLMDKVDSKFHLVHLAAKRAREINGYYSQLGEGLGQFVPPLVSTTSNKSLSIALEEIAQGKIEGTERVEAPSDDPLAFIEDPDESA